MLLHIATLSVFGQHLTSVRGSALGAFTALADDIGSIDWNPAGLVSIRDWDLTSSIYGSFRRDVPFTGVSLYTAGSAKRFLDMHVIAGSYSPGLDLEFVTPRLYELIGDGSKIGFEKKITYRELYALGYGYQVTPTVALGVSTRYREQLITDSQFLADSLGFERAANYSASAWNIDIGLNWKPSPEWSFGIVAKNLFRLTESELPEGLLSYGLRNVKTLRVGAAYRAGTIATVALDFDTQAMGGAGTEWNLSDQWALRQGFLFGGHSTQFIAGVAGGVGFAYGPAKINLSYVHFLDQSSRMQPTLDEFLSKGVQDLGYNAFTPSQLSISATFSLGRTRETWAKIEYVQILSEVYPSSYQVHAVRALGKASVKNVSSKPIWAKVSFFVDQYMDRPTETPRPVYIEPNAVKDIQFFAIFNEAIKFVPSMVWRAADVFVKASQAEEYDDKSQTRVIIRGRNDWDGDALSLQYFVTPEDPDIMRFTRSVMSQNKDTLAAAPKQLEKFRSARFLFNEFASRLTYVSDPKASKDRVQFPSETLALRGGDCDDMTVCFSSLLSSIGINTAFIDVVPPQRLDDAHIFMMFDTEVPATQSSIISDNPKRYVIRKNERGEETVWIPVETTAITEGFLKAWELGAKEYFDDVEVGLGVVRGWVRLVDVLPKWYSN